MNDARPIILNYIPQPRKFSPRAPIAILVAFLLFTGRSTFFYAGHSKPAPSTFTPVAPAQMPTDMSIGNSLNHNTEGPSVLYADGYIIPTTQPYAGESRGTNSNTWLSNIYTVQTSNLASQGGVNFGVPYDDNDAIMLPTSK
jgi:hypothetical protein